MTIAPAIRSIIVREARKDFADIQSVVANYNEMVEECRRQGYRAQYCIHGTNNWTDYDNICPGCEDGIFPQDTTYMDVLKDVLEEYRATQKRLKDSASDICQLALTLKSLGLYEESRSEIIFKIADEMRGRFI